jgi:chromosome segregation ATPase
MTRSAVARRATTSLLIAAAVVAGFGAIRVAAAWTAAAAPLEVSPASTDELRARLADQTDRSVLLEDRLATLVAHARELESALTVAQSRVDADAGHAQDLAAQLAAAKQKLAALQRSIRAAQATGTHRLVVTTSSATGGATREREGHDAE